MSGRFRFLLLFMLIGLIFGMNQAQEATLISPGIFLRGLELANGVRYTASFVKPTDSAVLRNLSVEITLPADAQFTEMLVSRQVEFDVIRRNGEGQLTLIWQISRIDAETALDTFSFTLAEPLSSELEFYMVWQDEQGQGFLENFFELPSTIRANQTEASIQPLSQEFAFVGNTGIQVSSSSLSPLNFRILANDFNPPAEYGSLWWCSLVELGGLSEGVSATLLVPLRRPVAPFTELFLFQQQVDGSWIALEEKGIVSADGQFVMYRHPGGLIATGGEEEIQQEIVPVQEAVIVEAPPPQENPPPQNNEAPPQAAPIENNVVVEVQQPEQPPQQNPVEPAPINQEQDNVAQATAVPASPIPPTNVPAPTQNSSDADGSSNTIIASEPSATANSGNIRGQNNNLVQQTPRNTLVFLSSSPTPFSTPVSTQNITDGSSNTLLLSEGTRNPTVTFGDGSVRSIDASPIATATFAIFPTQANPNQNIPDGSSNTTLFGERTLTPAFGDGSVRTITTATAVLSTTPTQPLGLVTRSGTIIGTGATATPSSRGLIVSGDFTATPIPSLLPFLPTATFSNTIQDGSSNTTLFGERTLTPAFGDGTVRSIDTTPIPTSAPTLLPFLPTATFSNTIQDGSSNTTLFGERTLTPAFGDGTVRQVTQSAPIPTAAPTLLPFIPTSTQGSGDGSVRQITQAPLSTALPTQGITDGSSNTTLFGERTLTPAFGDGTVRSIDTTPIPTSAPTLLPTATFSNTIQDGSSNTTLFGERTLTPAFGDGTVRQVTQSAPIATTAPTLLPFIPTSTQGFGDGTVRQVTQSVRDGTSNTTVVSEATNTALASASPSATRQNATATLRPTLAPTATPFVIITPPPFGTGGTRVLILQNAESRPVQCQIGAVLCATLNRRVGNGFR